MSARDPIQAAADAIKAYVPDGYGLMLMEARIYAHAAIAAYLRARADAYEAAGEYISAGIVRGLIPNEESPQ